LERHVCDRGRLDPKPSIVQTLEQVVAIDPRVQGYTASIDPGAEMTCKWIPNVRLVLMKAPDDFWKRGIITNDVHHRVCERIIPAAVGADHYELVAEKTA
jgi:hypothetical protein